MAEKVLQQSCLPNRNAGLSSEQILKAKRSFVETARAICPGWTVAPENRTTVNAIFEWCMGMDGELDPDKGLWLYGNIGTGKSTMLKIVKEFCRRIGRRDPMGNTYGFRISSALEICSRYQKEGASGIEEYITLPRQAFDEVGSEPTATGYYGTPMDVISTILMGRYDRRHENITHVTTNLSVDGLAARYKDRVYDRCREMFNFVNFKGKSYRGDDRNDVIRHT